MKRIKVISLALISLVLITSCSEKQVIVTGEVVSCNHIQVIKKASQNIYADCLDSSQGINIASIKGPAIINVWGSWCEPCKEEIPYFVELYQSLAPQIQLIGVDVEEKSPSDGRMFARTHGISWPNLYDSTGSTREYFGMGVPVTWFIDKDNKIAYKKIGPVNSVEELRTLTFKYLGAS